MKRLIDDRHRHRYSLIELIFHPSISSHSVSLSLSVCAYSYPCAVEVQLVLRSLVVSRCRHAVFVVVVVVVIWHFPSKSSLGTTKRSHATNGQIVSLFGRMSADDAPSVLKHN